MTPPPLDSRTPEPTSTPAPSLVQLTNGGCCVQPFWSPNGAQVWYIDRPSDVDPGGLWGVEAAGGGAPQFITDRLGLLSPDGALLAYPESGQTFVERRATGERWRVPAAGRAVVFSPDSTQIAWQTASSAVNFDRRVVEIWVSSVEGRDARSVARLIGGSLIDWFPDGGRLLVSGRQDGADTPQLSALNVADGARADLMSAANLRGVLLSPRGGWIAYQVAFSGDPALDGMWIAPTTGGAPVRLTIFGAYRWRAEGRLLVIPLELNSGSQRLVEIDAANGAQTDLTDPRVTAFRIAGGDWALSPTGDRIAFVNAADHNIWLITLPH